MIGVSGDFSLSEIELSLLRIESIISLSADRTIFSKRTDYRKVLQISFFFLRFKKESAVSMVTLCHASKGDNT